MSDERRSDRESEEIKVTDRRIFTADGQLRAEYRYLEEEKEKTGASPPAAEAPAAPEAPPAEAPPPEAPPAEAAPPPPGPAPPPVVPEGAPPPAGDQPAAGAERPPLELPPSTGGPGAPTFFDLVAVLAEPVQVYLGDVELPGGRSGENLEMARLYLDLLEILRNKTAMSLSSQESAFLEDVLYQLRMRYVQKRG